MFTHVTSLLIKHIVKTLQGQEQTELEPEGPFGIEEEQYFYDLLQAAKKSADISASKSFIFKVDTLGTAYMTAGQAKSLTENQDASLTLVTDGEPENRCVLKISLNSNMQFVLKSLTNQQTGASLPYNVFLVGFGNITAIAVD